MFFPSGVVFEPIYGHSVSLSGTGLLSLYILSLVRKYARIFFPEEIICSEKQTVFRGRSLGKTACFSEHIMSKDKIFESISAPNGGYCVYYPSNVFHNMDILQI